MDTLSRDSSSSSNSIVPIVGVIAGVVGILLGVLALVKVSNLGKTVAAQADEVAKISSIESEVRSASAKADSADSDMKALHDSVQNALTQVGTEIGEIKARIAKLEEAAKKPEVAHGKGGAHGVVTGTVDADGNYVVAPGDTLSKIAKKFATRVDAIEAENPGLDPAHLRVGQKVKIPKK